jgi:hypothetical protein
MTDCEYRSYKKLGGAEWLRSQIDFALNPEPTEIQNLLEYAFKNGIHQGDETVSDFLKLYEKAKYFYGWQDILQIFKKEGAKRFARENKLNSIGTQCYWCGKHCGGGCRDAEAYIHESIEEIKDINNKYNNLTI